MKKEEITEKKEKVEINKNGKKLAKGEKKRWFVKHNVFRFTRFSRFISLVVLIVEWN